MKLIVDASVAVKWLFTEEGSAVSRQLLAHRIVRYAPDFILIEAANVIWKKARRKETVGPQAYLEELARLSDAIVLCPSADLVAHASAIALEIDHPVYDCLYLACAEVEGARIRSAGGPISVPPSPQPLSPRERGFAPRQREMTLGPGSGAIGGGSGLM